MPTSDTAVAKRLRWYWPMEAANVVLVPAAALGWVYWVGGAPSLALAVAAIACSALLLIGALYWRAVLRQIEGASAMMENWLPRLAAVEGATLGLVVLAVGVTGLEGLLWGWKAAQIAAIVLTVLAVLEYVNYYQVQLQHFDNAADLKRLLTGRGFRKAHMARDIAAWRRKARRRP